MDHEPEHMFRQGGENVHDAGDFAGFREVMAHLRSYARRMRRHLVLPPRGRALVSTDLHGSWDDFVALRARFEALRASGPAHWILAGDLVHGPSDGDARSGHALYGYEDASPRLVREVAALVAADPEHVHFVLGNHDHGHVGGPRTAKFHPDEVAALEVRLGAAEKHALCTLFESALLAVALPCGALVCHGSPDDTLERLADLDTIALEEGRNDPYRARVLASWLRSYGQPESRTARLLEKLSRDLPFPLTFVLHGHDKDERGIFWEGKNQVCPVLFGAYREERRAIVLDLTERYPDARALRDGLEVVRVHDVPLSGEDPPVSEAPLARR